VHSQKLDFDEWVSSPEGQDKFVYDTSSATTADLLIYISPSGPDAWAEVGAAWAHGVPIFGLWAKSESIGLMRKMVMWSPHYDDLLRAVTIKAKELAGEQV